MSSYGRSGNSGVDPSSPYYRPAGMARVAAALDADGRPRKVACHYAGGGDGESVFMPYAIADKQADGRDAAHPIRLGAWRSVLNSQHGFFKESFVDELAHAAGKDPYHFRRDLLDEEPRSASVVALGDVHLLSLQRSSLERILRRYSSIAFNMMRILSQRLREAQATS